MGAFERMAAHDYGELHLMRDAGSGLEAIVALHDVRLGPGLGGTRFLAYQGEQEAVVDALRLARGMTYKAALAGLSLGGGKAVIIKPAGEFDRNALLLAFGRFVDALGGRYITTEDSGIAVADVEVMRQATKHVVGLPRAAGGAGDPSPFTALGVRRGIEACVKLKLEREALEGIRVAVAGVGAVGYWLCDELQRLGAKLVVADVDSERAAAARQQFGAEVVSPSEIHRVRCDVYAPCALGAVLNDATIPELACSIVGGAANNQLAEARHGEALQERGILYAPDYAINAGGLINVAQELYGYDENKSRSRVMKIYDTIHDVVERSLGSGQLPHTIADAMVEARLAQA